MWFPIVVPTWMISFSLSVILLKWLVIGKYRKGIIRIPSIAYLQWWFIDRAVSLWEFWVGQFIMDTPLINLFYFLMGVRVDHSVSIDAFLREFDLIKISEHSSIESSIHCRKFGPWDEPDGPSLHFCNITIGSKCVVKGMVSIGSNLKDQAYVERLSVVAEGATVPSDICAVGNPAFAMKSSKSIKIHNHPWSLGLLKVCWLVLELYHFFALSFLGQWLWGSHLPHQWHYNPLLQWSLVILWCSVMSVISSIVIK